MQAHTDGGHQYYNYTDTRAMILFKVFTTRINLNFLSFSEVVSIFRITFDTEIDSAINVHLDNHTIIKFNKCSGGIYCYDTTNTENKNTQTIYQLLLFRYGKVQQIILPQT